MKKILRWIWLHSNQLMDGCSLGFVLLFWFQKTSFFTWLLSLFIVLFLLQFFCNLFTIWLERAYLADCDPEPHLEAYLAYIRCHRRARLASAKASLWNAHLSASSALVSLGRFREAKEYLDAIDTSNLAPYSQVVYQHNRFVISHRLGYANWAVFSEYLSLAESILEKIRSKSQREMASEGLLYDRLMLRFWQEGTSEEIEAQFSRLLSQAKTEVHCIGYRLTLAQCALSRGDYAAARAHLEYVVAHGNKLYARTEAEELLRTLPEG